MTAGSAVVSADSPPAFGNLHAYDDAIVPWLREPGRRLPRQGCGGDDPAHPSGPAHRLEPRRLAAGAGASPVREPAHRAFPKEAEDWDIARIVADYAAAAQRMQAAGLDGIEFEAYGHLMDGFWSPATNRRGDAWGGSLENRMRFSVQVVDAVRKAVGHGFSSSGCGMVADEDWAPGSRPRRGGRDRPPLRRRRQGRFPQHHPRPYRDRRGADPGDPGDGHALSAPHLDFAGEVRAETGMPVFHAARIQDVATARHAVASGKLDMVGMTRAHIADPAYRRQAARG